jgi:hypothetical protein
MILKDDLAQDVPTVNGPMRTYFFRPTVENAQYPGIILYSEIFQMTGPIRRFATFLFRYDCPRGYSKRNLRSVLPCTWEVLYI